MHPTRLYTETKPRNILQSIWMNKKAAPKLTLSIKWCKRTILRCAWTKFGFLAWWIRRLTLFDTCATALRSFIPREWDDLLYLRLLSLFCFFGLSLSLFHLAVIFLTRTPLTLNLRCASWKLLQRTKQPFTNNPITWIKECEATEVLACTMCAGGRYHDCKCNTSNVACSFVRQVREVCCAPWTQPTHHRPKFPCTCI